MGEVWVWFLNAVLVELSYSEKCSGCFLKGKSQKALLR